MVKSFDPELAREIMSYYLRNPRAVDTLDGVAQWRLLDQQVHRTLLEVRRALAWLVERGYLVESRRSGSRPLLSLNQDRVAEARRFIEEGESPDQTGPQSHEE